jgi:hypothetical protein
MQSGHSILSLQNTWGRGGYLNDVPINIHVKGMKQPASCQNNEINWRNRYSTTLRLSISMRWRFLIYPFLSRLGQKHWVNLSEHWMIVSIVQRVYFLSNIRSCKHYIYVSSKADPAGLQTSLASDTIWTLQRPNQNTVGSQVLQFKIMRSTQNSMTKLVALPLS